MAAAFRGGIVKLTNSSSIDPQDAGLQPVVNPPCWASKTAVSFNLTIPSRVLFSGSLFGGRSNSSRYWGRSRASSRACSSQSRVVVGLVLDDRADEDQTAGAALAFGGGDAGLGASDLTFESFFPLALGFDQLFFPLLEFLLESVLPGQKLIELFLWIHRCRW